MAVEVGMRQKSGLPPGAKVIQAGARALTGEELGVGVRGVVEGVLKELGVRGDGMLVEWDQKVAGHPQLGKRHLTFPKAWVGVEGRRWKGGECAVSVVVGLTEPARAMVGLGSWVEGLNGVEPMEVVRKQIGPEAAPDRLREQLGLGVLVEVEMPTGERRMVEVKGRGQGEVVVEREVVPVVEPIVEPLRSASPVELPQDMLVAAEGKDEMVGEGDVGVSQREAPKRPVVGRPRVEVGQGRKGK